LIRSLQRRFARLDPTIVRGIGDDTAVLRGASTEWSLITTDLMTEGVHFDLRTSSFADIGYRATIANLSDIAAMGGRPRYLLVALAIPSGCSKSQIQQLYRGMMSAADPYRVRLIGGDTSASRHGLFVSITLTGSTKAGQVLLRRGARVEDLLYVTGTLGDSRAGLQLLTSHRRVGGRLRSPHQRFLLGRHHRPTARIAEGRWLASQGLASAAIDLSDGLSGDLRHLCEESGVGAEVIAASLPLSAACRAFAEAAGLDACSLALAGGEDYELLFTVPPGKHRRFERLASQTDFRFTRIGAIMGKGTGLRLRSQTGMSQSLPHASYEHFLRPS
jgi:thiamine-monophosphate kinase